MKIKPIQNEDSLPISINYDPLRELDRYNQLVLDKLNKNTKRALESDKKNFSEFCLETGEKLSIEPELLGLTIIRYAEWMITKKNKRNSVERRLASLRKLLRIMKIPDPMATDETFKEALKLTLRKANARSRQAEGAKVESIKEITDLFLENEVDPTYKQVRDMAMLNVAFDTLLRRSDLVAIDIKDLSIKESCVFVNSSKTDQNGKGEHKHLTRTSLSLISWLLELTPYSDEGPLFRPAKKNGDCYKDVDNNKRKLNGGEVSRIFKSIFRKNGLSVSSISGHSTRVGATQTMFEQGEAISNIMHAGSWKSQAMPMRYGEKHSLTKSATANVAKKTGR